MATNFSANQYESAFASSKIQNWEVPNKFRERPRSIKGQPKVIANDQGHLLPEYRRSNTRVLNGYVGTWDLPKKIPGNRIRVPTARSKEAFDRLQDTENTSGTKTRRQPKVSSIRSETKAPAIETDGTDAERPRDPCCCDKHCSARSAPVQNDGDVTGRQDDVGGHQDDVTDRSEHVTEGFDSNRIVAL